MNIKKTLLVKSVRELVTITAANARYRYPRGRDQNKYKFTVS